MLYWFTLPVIIITALAILNVLVRYLQEVCKEWGGSDICINFLVNLINSYTTRTDLTYGNMIFPSYEIRNMLENIDIIVFPDVNPDAKKYSQTHDDTKPLSLNDQNKMR
jgi:murein tripeptide amidase MpaA